MAHLLDLCTDVVAESDKSYDPVLLDCLVGLKNHNTLRHADDEELKTFLKCTHQLLNETRTRTKGLMLLDNFVTQIDSSRFISFQDSLQSTLNLLTKCLDLDLTHKVLGTLLPMCHKIPELSQVVVSTIIPKLFTHFIENSSSSSSSSCLPNNEELALVLACLERYRGPCGLYRQQLEKIVISFIDSLQQDEAGFEDIAKIFPLLSATGGGGNKGDKYSHDWLDTVTKILHALYDALVVLISDVCPHLDAENPYLMEGVRPLDLISIHHSNVLLRMSLMNRRLLNLTRVLTSFLFEPFPATKFVPIHGILNLVCSMMMVNPVSLLKNKSGGDDDVAVPRENINLSNLLPSIHLAALELLDKLILSCGNQIFPDASRIELLLVQEFKWIDEKPKSFENLKSQMYTTFKSWLTITNGSVTTNKNAVVLMQQIIQDIKIDKQSVSLSLGVKSKKGKKQSNNKLGASLVNTSKSVDTQQVEKNGILCAAALECLEHLIPALNFASHRAAYLILATTVGDFTESSDYPSPYNMSDCRSGAFKCLVQLALHPHYKSPVSLALINSLVELGTKDDNHKVAAVCHNLLTSIERIVHPSSATLQFPQVKVVPPTSSSTLTSSANIEEQGSALDEYSENDNMIIDLVDDDDSDDDEQSTNSIDNGNESGQGAGESVNNSMNESNTSIANISSSSLMVDPSVIKDYVAQALRENLTELLELRGKKHHRYFDSSDEDCTIIDNDSDPHQTVRVPVDSRATSSHSTLVKDMERDQQKKKGEEMGELEIVEPPCKKVKTWTVGNGVSSTTTATPTTTTTTTTTIATDKQVDNGVSVTVEEILLNFDDNIVLVE